MTLSHRSFSTLAIRIRYFICFHKWPRDLTIARLNLKYGREFYRNGTVGTIAFKAEDADIYTGGEKLKAGFVYMDVNGKVMNTPDGTTRPVFGIAVADSEPLPDGKHHRVMVVTRGVIR